MGRKRKQRRQPHGSAWHWKQTGCWYYTLPGTKKRIPLFDEKGQRIRGKENKDAAEQALAKEKVSWEDDTTAATAGNQQWNVARACSEYIQYCDRGVASGTISKGHRDSTVSWLNDLCTSYGSRPIARHHRAWADTTALIDWRACAPQNRATGARPRTLYKSLA